ncbi:hypothetical protein F751_1120 [Auxenochlorella protothecoides]|uniref:Uncharacterized protein n=1 Tax=Auxenochlorella protothecoides TaxID=3075 RepID=A0A087SCH0_AUXPR|nr:hypothetical protein F751_1120 [Auxenochlorella protothecoides]KFM23424.1 hypothetical protein F751_1120 [Auxenochlorella protothecoides]
MLQAGSTGTVPCTPSLKGGRPNASGLKSSREASVVMPWRPKVRAFRAALPVSTCREVG